MKKLKTYLALFLVSVCVCACSSKRTPDEIKATKPECDNAKEQLKMLDEEMVATHERTLAGITSVVPSLAVITALSGNYKQNFAIATGSYEKALHEKMDEIRQICGLQDIPMKSDSMTKKETKTIKKLNE